MTRELVLITTTEIGASILLADDLKCNVTHCSTAVDSSIISFVAVASNAVSVVRSIPHLISAVEPETYIRSLVLS